MKRVIALMLILALGIVSCAKVIVRAPAGSNIRIGSGEVVNADKQKRVFYILMGLIPLNDNSTEDMLADVPAGSTVVIEEKMTFVDYILSGILSVVTIQCKTVVVDVQ
jgi:hypothetical protein